MAGFLSLGLDIGTTTISAVVVEPECGSVLASRTRKSSADIPSAIPGEKLQDPEIICTLACSLLDELLEQFPGVGSIGITGQMHGIVYQDPQGMCISPLYTWQDQRAAPLCARLQKITGCPVAPGYGLATHCALMEEKAVPEKAARIVTIMDHIVGRLCERTELQMHASNAASLGFFDLGQGSFEQNALAKLGIDPKLLPPVTRDTKILGYYRNIPVAVPIGDNQAGFLGSVSHPETTVLVNFGTGSQISRMVRSLPEGWTDHQVEVRPYLGHTYLLCGSALCGGRAYALLEGFFRRFLAAGGMSEDNGYAVLNELALKGMQESDLPRVETTFCGTRWEPEKRGSITALSEANFTPEALTAGLLIGMAEELRQLLLRMPGEMVEAITVSGNAVQKNPALQQAVTRVFGVQAVVSVHQEEAAFGAALFAAEAVAGETAAIL